MYELPLKGGIAVKPRILWLVAAFFMTSLFRLCTAEASVVDDIMGYNPGSTQTYTYSVTDAGQPQYNGAAQYRGPATYPATPVTQRRPMIAQQPAAPQAPLPQAQPYSQPQPQRKAVAKKKPVRNPAAANGIRSAKTQTAKQPQQRLAATPYQQSYPAQHRPVPQQGYYQAPQTGYNTNPYQNQYRAAPNYYQGYSYNNWGSSPQACPPGRA
jgi:hypothetical protein